MTIPPHDPAYQDPIEVAWRTIEDLRERLTAAEAENASLHAELRETSRDLLDAAAPLTAAVEANARILARRQAHD
jgi:hypothetical protein